MVGFGIAERFLQNQSAAAELLSLFGRPKYRSQGVAERLANELELALEMPMGNPQKLGE